MAFWGVEVRTGRPFTHSPHILKGRLRISQATLGIGASAAHKTFVRCSVGNKSPVLLCALVPDKTDSCHLDLEFEEREDVVFSVIGLNAIFLTGYYVRGSHNFPTNSDTESYGVDIEISSGSDDCNGDDDEYDDSFIDDDDEVSHTSSEMETSMEIIPKTRNLKARLERKRCRQIDSDEDSFILSRIKSNNSKKNIVCEGKPKVNIGSEIKNTNENIVLDSEEEELFTFTAFKRKDNGNKAEPTVNSGGEVKNAANKSCKDQPDIVDAKNQEISGIDAMKCKSPKKKRQELSNDTIKEVKEQHHEDRSGYVSQDPQTNIKEKNLVHEIDVEGKPDPLTKPANFGVELIPIDEKPTNAEVELIPNLANKNAGSTTISTSSNGVEIIELSKGKLDGKVAAMGKKVKILYTAMLKDNGDVVDSSVGKSPYKFRLGKEGVIEGLHFGINGMRVGEKRKLIIPPSMGFGNQGSGENVPPDSWLVYEVELLGVSK